MKQEQFVALVEQRIDKCMEVLGAKGKEYSGGGKDRLHNFKRAAEMQGISPAAALRGMWAKHIVSIMDMFDAMDNGHVPTSATVEEKLGDNINYSLLFEALITEMREKRSNSAVVKKDGDV